MNQERPNEAIAKQIVERVMGIQLEHADTRGGVDYVSIDGAAALEVTAVTDEEKKKTRKAFAASMETTRRSLAAHARTGGPPRLKACWMVFTSDTQRRAKSFEQRVQPLIAELELADETSFDDQKAARHVLERGELSHIYQPLLDAGVQGAIPIDSNRTEDPEHVHFIFPSTGSGGRSSGSNESLDRLMDVLNKKTDNQTKLRNSGASRRHLFVWLDDDTEHEIARPLSQEESSLPDDRWGLPRTKPQLHSAITHLWVMHDRTRLGWLWDGKGWRELRDP